MKAVFNSTDCNIINYSRVIFGITCLWPQCSCLESNTQNLIYSLIIRQHALHFPIACRVLTSWVMGFKGLPGVILNIPAFDMHFI